MIVLSEEPAPRWVPLYSGARLFADPPITAIVYAARAAADRLFADLKASGEAVTRSGGRIVGTPDLSTDDGERAAKDALFVAALADLAVTDWEGIGTKNGVAVPFDASLLPLLLKDAEAADAFLARYLRPIHEVVLEGNG